MDAKYVRCSVPYHGRAVPATARTRPSHITRSSSPYCPICLCLREATDFRVRYCSMCPYSIRLPGGRGGDAFAGMVMVSC
jgi:hypothetical protein